MTAKKPVQVLEEELESLRRAYAVLRTDLVKLLNPLLPSSVRFGAETPDEVIVRQIAAKIEEAVFDRNTLELISAKLKMPVVLNPGRASILDSIQGLHNKVAAIESDLERMDAVADTLAQVVERLGLREFLPSMRGEILDAITRLQRERDGGIAEKAVNSRQLLIQFIQLTYSRQTRIARSLDLLDPAFSGMADMDRCAEIFKQARDKGLLVRMSELVAAEEKDMRD